jgi:uncharacterized protein (TIGR04255 family)
MPRARRQYEKPPLVAVTCELLFEYGEGAVWDQFLMRDFYQTLEEHYPQLRQSSVGNADTLASESGRYNAGEGRFSPRFYIESGDGKTSVGVGERLLVVTQLPPYYGWEKFEPRVVEATDRYARTWKPALVVEAVLHYIDRVDIPENEFRLQDYFNLYPSLPEGTDGHVANLEMNFEIQAERESDVLAVSFRQYPSATPDCVSFLLTWDYIASKPIDPDQVSIKGWLKDAHEFSGRFFRASLTDRCEQLFEPKGDPNEPISGSAG